VVSKEPVPQLSSRHLLVIVACEVVFNELLLVESRPLNLARPFVFRCRATVGYSPAFVSLRREPFVSSPQIRHRNSDRHFVLRRRATAEFSPAFQSRDHDLTPTPSRQRRLKYSIVADATKYSYESLTGLKATAKFIAPLRGGIPEPPETGPLQVVPETKTKSRLSANRIPPRKQGTSGIQSCLR
jgi:hypothetical protein